MITLFSTTPVYAILSDSLELDNKIDSTTIDFENVVSQVDINAVSDHMRYLSSLGSRMSGYPGCEEAGEYIYDQFIKLGLSNVSKQYFDVVSLIDYGANLTLVSPINKTIKIFPLYSNGIIPVVTLSSGISGELVYAAKGLPSDIEGKKIEGNIVLMDFNSGQRWKDMAYFGAKAVIFIEPPETLRTEAEFKRLRLLPYNFPRFYIKHEDVSYLLNLLGSNKLEVKVHSDSGWEEVQAFNVMGFVGGSDFPEKYILITTYYDSFSIVPSISPGASESFGVAALIELAQFFKNNQPKNTILFIAFGGHWQGLIGSRNFVEELIFQPGPQNIYKNIISQFNLQLSPDTSVVAPSFFSSFYTQGDSWEIGETDAVGTIIKNTLPEIRKQLGGFELKFVEEELPLLFFLRANPLSYYHPFYYPWYDHEPLQYATPLPAISFSTLNSFHKYLRTPIDVFHNIDPDNLIKQLKQVYCYLFVLVNSTPDDLIVGGVERIPEKPSRMGGWMMGFAGFISFTGQVVEWNFSTGYYTPVSDALVAILNDEYYPSIGSGGDFILYKTDEKGKFKIIGLSTADGYGRESIDRTLRSIYAFKLDESGSIIYAPDMGRYCTARTIGTTFMASVGFNPVGYMPINDTYVTIMRCGSIVLFDVLDPYYIGQLRSTQISINEFRSHTTPISFGLITEYTEPYSMAVVFVSPDKPHEIIIRDPTYLVHPIAILTNASETNLDGVGYSLKVGQQITLTATSLHYAQNLLYLNLNRVSKLQKTGVIYDLRLLNESIYDFERAKKSYENYNFEPFSSYSLSSWESQRNANVELRDLATSIINSVPFFGILLIPFALFAERLIVRSQGLKRLAALLFLYVLTTIVFSFLHPGFPLAFNIWILVLGLALLTLIVPVIVLIFQNFTDLLRELRSRFLGEHELITGTTSSVLAAFTLGPENMRRRTFRTGLTLTSIIIIVFSLVLFTSLIPLPFHRLNVIQGEPLYFGIETKHSSWFELRSGVDNMASDLKFRYENCVIAPKAWVYPASGKGIRDKIILVSAENYSFVRALLGLTPEEIELTHLDQALLSGRWFTSSDVWACILSKFTADTMSVKVGDAITISGLDFTVIGIVDGDTFSSLSHDLDQEQFTPIDTTVPGFAAHLIPSRFLIIPYDTAFEFLDRSSSNVFTASISLKFEDPEKILGEGVKIFNRYKLNIYLGTPQGVMFLGKGSFQTLLGWEYQIIPMAIAALTIIMQMIGSVYERKGEIFTMVTLGLAPMNVILLFMAEGCIYSILGSVFGYVLAVGTGRLAGVTFLNFGSNWVVMSVFTSIILVILSTVYPASRASVFATPSRIRRWEYPTMPKGREWEFSIPFVVDSDEQAIIVLSFLNEFLEAHTSPLSEVFSAQSIRYKKGRIENRNFYSIEARISLTPYDLNLNQNVALRLIQEEEKYLFDIHFALLSGTESDWVTHNRKFVNAIREQLLLWRDLKPKDRERYLDMGREFFGKEKP